MTSRTRDRLAHAASNTALAALLAIIAALTGNPHAAAGCLGLLALAGNLALPRRRPEPVHRPTAAPARSNPSAPSAGGRTRHPNSGRAGTTQLNDQPVVVRYRSGRATVPSSPLLAPTLYDLPAVPRT